ncbi:restriction endonuclease [Plantactinospora sp. WMMC1484]|uniref:restriction endonuclease n=1 Tax=Plantactinospora sp. WMMC1484 TaxID=3404122 RepID=UPI003BF5E5FF
MDRNRVPMLDVFRYPRGASPIEVEVDGYPNYHHITAAPGRDLPRLMLERGINPAAMVQAPDERRRPVITIRSSPWKAGHATNPWHDEFDLDHGHVRYYGDHKPDTTGLPGATAGNRALLEAWRHHAGTSAYERSLAPPLLLFRSATVLRGGRRVVKGHVEFCGVAVIERLEHIVQRDPSGGRSFPNLVLDLAVLDLAPAGDTLDLRWIDDRRDASLTTEQTHRFAPASWLRWVDQGRAAIPRVRRRVVSSRVRTASEQLPVNPDDMRVLWRLYHFFDDRKHAFELLAARVAAQLLAGSGAMYRDGWLTRAGGDGGMDFVGRLDVGAPGSSTPLVVLGQAKCVAPSSSISPDQVARVVARLRRGWIGVFVTTGTFSRQAQIEVIDDQYPLVLVGGRTLVEQVLRMAAADYDGDLDALLRSVDTGYEAAVAHRRPEEILSG